MDDGCGYYSKSTVVFNRELERIAECASENDADNVVIELNIMGDSLESNKHEAGVKAARQQAIIDTLTAQLAAAQAQVAERDAVLRAATAVHEDVWREILTVPDDYDFGGKGALCMTLTEAQKLQSLAREVLAFNAARGNDGKGQPAPTTDTLTPADAVAMLEAAGAVPLVGKPGNWTLNRRWLVHIHDGGIAICRPRETIWRDCTSRAKFARFLEGGK